MRRMINDSKVIVNISIAIHDPELSNWNFLMSFFWVKEETCICDDFTLKQKNIERSMSKSRPVRDSNPIQLGDSC